MRPMHKSTYSLKVPHYTELRILLFEICSMFVKTIWATKPCKILNYQKWPKYQWLISFLSASLTPNINKGRWFFKSSVFLPQELIFNFNFYLLDPCTMWYLRTLSPSHILVWGRKKKKRPFHAIVWNLNLLSKYKLLLR